MDLKGVVAYFAILTMVLAFTTMIMGMVYGFGPTMHHLWMGALLIYGAGILGVIAVRISIWGTK